jgi:hypothetical protein
MSACVVRARSNGLRGLKKAEIQSMTIQVLGDRQPAEMMIL